MKILLIGSGGREHALAWKISQSPKVTKIFVSPGNAGTKLLKKCSNIEGKSNNELLFFAIKNKIDLTIVGPEQPLVDGIVDLFEKHKLKIFGPSKFAAQLEGSKIFAKKFMKKFNVATAKYESFINPVKAKAYLNSINFPVVIKADGLAAGKGVNICFNKQEAIKTIDIFMISDVFKGAGLKIIIEEYLQGVEASIICVTDGKSMVPLMSAKDYKTIHENNHGANTGGMGAICPNPYVTDKILKDFKINIMNKTLSGIKKMRMNFKGFVFFGVMITPQGCKLLEYNVRMGDPECQSIMMMINFDLTNMFMYAIKRKLHLLKMK
jgi:phosphoribosylamine--glycine ligase